MSEENKVTAEQFEEWQQLAEYGDAGAQYNLGVCYQNGQGGVEKNLETSIVWNRKAAKQGHAFAQYNLGVYYEKGEGGVKQNFNTAAKWYRKAAKQDNAFAQCNLGVCYDKGQGVKQNFNTAAKWYRKAADHGNAFAQRNLGVSYEQGRGVKQNLKKAVKWYSKAADQGHAFAQFNLGRCYENGIDGENNLEEAIRFYRQSLNGGIFEYINGEDRLPELAEIACKIHKILEEQRIKPKDNISDLTHFTRYSTFEKLLDPDEPSAFRLSNIDGCNDPMEGKTLYEWLNIEGINCPDLNDSYPLISSFCNGSPENLPMWNTYADKCTGVGLFMDMDSLGSIISNQDLYSGNAHRSSHKNASTDKETQSESGENNRLPSLYRVIYLSRESESQTEFNPESVHAYIQDLKKTTEYLLQEKDSSEYASLLSKMLVELSHIIKYDDYQYEKEVRLVRFAFKQDIDDGVLKNCSESHRVYIEAKDLRVKKITTGPKVKDTPYRYAKYLGDCKNIDVVKSKIQFR